MNIPTRDGLARAIRYQRRHYLDRPHPLVTTQRERNVVCVMRAAQSFGAQDKHQLRHLLNQPIYNPAK